MPESIKVEKERFEEVMRALLKASPIPMAEIPRKREPKPKKRAAKKRG